MRDLFILGVGVHGAEMAEIVERINRVQPIWNLLGFLAPDSRHVGTVRNGVPVLGSLEQLEEYPHACLIADNEWSRDLPVPRARMVSLVDPSAFVSRTATLGSGCVLYPHCFVGLNAQLGNDIFCLSGSILNHDVVLEDRVVIASGVSLAGSVHVEADCYLGQSCTIRQELRIGRGSMIGMGAVVVKDVAPNSVIVGNPGRKLRDRHSNLSHDAP
jgi:sugar O-acyltransferase (sialic acid O-acetyltransferase NeuD family)